MKVFNFFAQVFAIFAFLTLGSLMMMVSFHILDYNDALYKLQELYQNPIRSLQIGFTGLIFIFVGLVFTKVLLKQGRSTEAIFFQSEIGPIVVTIPAIEDVARKVVRRFHLVKDCRVKTKIDNKNLDLSISLTLWSGSRIPDLVGEIQEEVKNRIRKLTGPECRIEIACDVKKIEDHEAEFPLSAGQVASL